MLQREAMVTVLERGIHIGLAVNMFKEGSEYHVEYFCVNTYFGDAAEVVRKTFDDVDQAIDFFLSIEREGILIK